MRRTDRSGSRWSCRHCCSASRYPPCCRLRRRRRQSALSARAARGLPAATDDAVPQLVGARAAEPDVARSGQRGGRRHRIHHETRPRDAALLLVTGTYIILVTIAGQAAAWWIVGLRQIRIGRIALLAAAAALIVRVHRDRHRQAGQRTGCVTDHRRRRSLTQRKRWRTRCLVTHTRLG